MLGQTLWAVDLVLGNTTTIGKGVDHHYWKNNSAYKEAIMLGQALRGVAMVLRSKMTIIKIVDRH
jgi:hypothetical protein